MHCFDSVISKYKKIIWLTTNAYNKIDYTFKSVNNKINKRLTKDLISISASYLLVKRSTIMSCPLAVASMTEVRPI